MKINFKKYLNLSIDNAVEQYIKDYQIKQNSWKGLDQINYFAKKLQKLQTIYKQ